ncbi:hypothetical protein HYE82_14005 [Streptomyces sp. BR123]|nr:hypothetical protein [Streptomyces sp. BR123]
MNPSGVQERRSAFGYLERSGDREDVSARVVSRRLLMREYLRRAGLGARARPAESTWPTLVPADR